MFSFNPELAAQNDMEDGDEAFDSYAYAEEEEEIQYKELELDLICGEAQEVDGTGTVATEDRLKGAQNGNATQPVSNGVDTSESSGSGDGAAAAVPINENLFMEDDLDDLDDELNDLDLDE